MTSCLRRLVVACFSVAMAAAPQLSAAQMRPGAVTEKTYGLGLPRDMDKLLIPDADYPDYPLKRGQEAYADVDGERIKKGILDITAISLKSLDDGNQYWGRIPGTPYATMTADYMANAYAKLGLVVRRQPAVIPKLWYPTHWEGAYAFEGRSGALKTLFPIDDTVATPPEGVTAEAIWVGIGAAPDLLGRDVKGKAVIIYSTFVPGGRSHSASDRAKIFDSDTLATKAGVALIINVMAVPGNAQFNPEGAPSGPGAVPTLTVSQDEGFMLRDMLASGKKVQISVKLDIEVRRNVPVENVYATLPGESDEQVILLSHTDAFFQGAMDNASGMATGIDTSQTLLYMVDNNIMTSNAVSARRWYASGSPELQDLIRRTFKDFNVSVYKVPEPYAGGSLGALTKFAPAFHIIDHVIYHTTLDTPELVPAVGLGWSERAFLSILDETSTWPMARIRGAAPLPNPAK
jgi:hypothetical protein